ncbi:sigma-70 family RNA polymerase sigma factor [Gimesia sp.]|uniref:sigma-70 family RNA polymerase sigma factor n=1 Tax=Gimesia sp. TaxID=2024833 RepID=UPI000C507FD1|nr:sigma-70 family RNA polymerase sigma factor [Gimesia sp.]MAX37420.1 hypothetical protein [Gimesia sp.]HAH43446.1 hypothetical protein [Planctomycetaceae bacterium]HBL44272.1 hypothetical protein [Planctomycetaceae bacterium]|tara:strand:+ start:2731 stop:3246 length:516 start_codon:yes stop_codon:yes gene_type:complete
MITEEFILNVTECQGQLYSYILSLTGNSDIARDLLQETNKSILEKVSDYTPGTSFSAWASKIAFFKVLSFHRDRQREPMLFSVERLREISQKTLSRNQEYDRRLDFLFQCIEQLPDDKQKLLRQRYEQDLPLEELASLWGRTYNATAALLYRVRLTLMDCVNKSLKLEKQI